MADAVKQGNIDAGWGMMRICAFVLALREAHAVREVGSGEGNTAGAKAGIDGEQTGYGRGHERGHHDDDEREPYLKRGKPRAKASRTAAVSQIESKSAGTVRFSALMRYVTGGKGDLIVIARSGEVLIHDDNGRERERHKVPYGATLQVKDALGLSIQPQPSHTDKI